MKKFLIAFVAGFLPAFVLLLSVQTSQAGSATWKPSPGSGDWNTAGNWTTGGPPNGPADAATFATSNRTAISLSANTEVNGIVFNAGASAFTITSTPALTLTISGVGITNNSGITQHLATGVDTAGQFGTIVFTNGATAGSETVITNNGAAANNNGGITEFHNTSTAGTATVINNGGTATLSEAGFTEFFDSSTAANGIFINNGAAFNGQGGGVLEFFNNSTAGEAAITVNGGTASGAFGGNVDVRDVATLGNAILTLNGGTVPGAAGGTLTFETINGQRTTAGNSTIIINGGTNGGAGGLVRFFAKSLGGTARIEVFGNGNMDISIRALKPLTTGSIEGNGVVFLGAHRLIVGANNLSTRFSGTIQDGGMGGGTGGSLTKTGNGKLTLTKANTYTGRTTIKRGKLMVNNSRDSGTGSGPVQVDRGRLGGKGIIAGAVTVGTGSGLGAILSPGYQHGPGSPGALTIQNPLTFNSDASYELNANSSNVTADEVIANGVTINSGAQFSFADLGSGTLTPGTVFTAISNTAATPIAGTFSNLADGSIFTSNGNSYQASYTGGDGNDLTLTVVP